MILKLLPQVLMRIFWIVVPHPFRPQSQFASAVCGRCGFQCGGTR